MRSLWRRVPRGVGWLAAISVLYLLVEQLFVYATRTAGLLSPGGTPHWGVLAIGAAYLALRLAALFVVPAVAVYLGARRLLQGLVFQRGSPSKSQGS